MMLKVVLLAAMLFVTLARGVPIQQEVVPEASGPEPPLLRVKRTAETIMYGNHQNSARVKKAGPIPPLAPLDQEEAELDHQASVRSEVLPAQDETPGEAEPSPAVQGVIENMVAPPVPDATEDEEEGDLEQLMTAEGSPQAQPPLVETAGPEGAAVSDYDYGKQYPEDASKYPADYYNPALYDYLYGYQGYQGRRKRSAPKEHQSAVQAEDMGSVDLTSNRIKRDLPDYFGEDYDNFDEYQPEYGYNDDEKRESLSVPDSALASAYLEALLERPEEEDEDVYPEEQEPYVDPYDYEAAVAAAYEEERAEEEAEEEAARERLQMLEYLYEQQAEEEAQEREEQAALEQAAYEKRSGWPGMGPADEAEYKEIVHDGVPGIFFPVKRQYLSMVPGVRKRGFYPAGVGADGRWGALVQSEMEKRSEEEMYDRLYQLASALRGDEYDDGYVRK